MALRCGEENEKMWELVENYLKTNGYQLTPSCEKLFRQFVSNGESRLDRQLLPSSREVAERRLRTFLDEMMIGAERSKTNIISEDVFDSVSKRLSPIPPFC